MIDPRACKIPMTEFNHLSLAEIAEFDAIPDLSERFWDLLAKRVFPNSCPDRGHNKGDAA